MRIWLLSCLFLLLFASPVHASESRAPDTKEHANKEHQEHNRHHRKHINKHHKKSESSWFELRTLVELGFVAPLSHKIQLGRDGTYFDYVDEGGQDNLFNFARLSLEAVLNERHIIIFLLQPLDFQSRVELRRDLIVQNVTFPEGSGINLRYGFPYYRVSYMFDLLGSDRTELGVGASFQFRNATLEFISTDGELIYTSRDVGPVPILKVRLQHWFDNGLWFGVEADGFYAPGAIFNLRDNDVLGAILDASLRLGLQTSHRYNTFLNLRYVGGGADGASEDPDEPGDGYTKNWLHLMSVSIGVTYNLF